MRTRCRKLVRASFRCMPVAGLALGIALCAPAQAQLTLPFNGNVSSAGPAFVVRNDNGDAIAGYSQNGVGVHGVSQTYFGVVGEGLNAGVLGENIAGGSYGVEGIGDVAGVYGYNNNNSGMKAGVYGQSVNGPAILGQAGGGAGSLAGMFLGNVTIQGTLTATTKNFTVDDPRDPENRVLVHSTVESSDMKNLYDGVVKLDDRGEATVQVPGWFQVLNADYRYQLTAIGAQAPGLYISKELDNGKFQIAGGKPGMKVSWQVTGNRQDAYAKAHPLVVEQPKPAELRGLQFNK